MHVTDKLHTSLHEDRNEKFVQKIKEEYGNVLTNSCSFRLTRHISGHDSNFGEGWTPHALKTGDEDVAGSWSNIDTHRDKQFGSGLLRSRATGSRRKMRKQGRRNDVSTPKIRLVLCVVIVFSSLLAFVSWGGIFAGTHWLDRFRMTRLRNMSVLRGEELLRPEHNMPLPMRIYVYKEDEIDGLKELMAGRDGSIDPKSCMWGQWGTQVKIHFGFLSSSFRTKNKDRATFFFVPAYIKCMSIKGGLTEQEMNEKYIQVIEQMPYFKRSGGRDHVFVFPSGNGAHFFRDWAIHISKSIFLTPEGDKTDKKDSTAFNTWKDIIIPGNVDRVKIVDMVVQGVTSPVPLNERDYLANYIGHAQGKAGRLKLVALAKKFPMEVEVPELHRHGPDSLDKSEYFAHLRNAKFCLAPRGESSWTLRFFEAFFVDCVPVILSDNIEFPFQNLLDYKQFSIKWPQNRIDESLLEYLRSIPDEAIERMIARGREVRCLWIYSPESEQCSAMTGILWELQRKVRLFQQSSETFWLHDGTFVNADLTPMIFGPSSK